MVHVNKARVSCITSRKVRSRASGITVVLLVGVIRKQAVLLLVGCDREQSVSLSSGDMESRMSCFTLVKEERKRNRMCRQVSGIYAPNLV